MDNLNSALTTWNDKLAELWTLISTSPESFKGGGVWTVIQNINGALQAVGYGLLVLFFAAGVVKTCGSFAELKKPEMAFRCFVRFVLAQAAIGHGMELMMALFNIAQGMVSTIMSSSGLTAVSATALPSEMVTTIESVGFIDSIPLWAITLLGYGQRIQWNNVIDTGVMLNWDKRPYDGKRESNLSVTFDATLRF